MKMQRTPAGVFILLLSMVFVMLSPGLPALAQAASGTPRATAGNSITATSGDVVLQWNGRTGSFLVPGAAGKPDRRYTLSLIYVEAGPTGYAQHLAWFLARDDSGFALLWVYLDDTGTEFWAWIYRYPRTDLDTLKFIGNYRFVNPVPAHDAAGPMSLTSSHVYIGLPFAYRDWTVQTGHLSSLTLKTVSDVPAPAAPLLNLRATPLACVKVGDANGWNNAGWYELHAAAHSEDGRAYYLILYSNTAEGYAVRLSDGAVFKAEYGEPVHFQTAVVDTSQPQALAPVDTAPTITVQRFHAAEIELTSTVKHPDPYGSVDVAADFLSPNGDHYVIPGFWDGESTWRIRVAPTQAGTWHWRTRSNDMSLAGQSGAINCEPADDFDHGFVRIGKSHPDRLEYSDSVPYLPLAIPAPLQINDDEFNRFVTAQTDRHVNRLTGGFVLDCVMPDAAAGKGRQAFNDDRLQHLDPLFFQRLDKRVTKLEDHGIIPDIAISASPGKLMDTVGQAPLERLWRYLVARYGAFNVCWSLFDMSAPAHTLQVYAPIDDLFASAASSFEMFAHPATTVYSPATLSASAPDIPSWMSLITVNSLDTAVKARACGRPIVLQSVLDGDAARQEMWQARLNGFYWAPRVDLTPASSSGLNWLFASEGLLSRTRYYRMHPHQDLIIADAARPVSGNLVLADPGWEYLAYMPKGGTLTLNAPEAFGRLAVEWIDAKTGETRLKTPAEGSAQLTLTAPDAGEWVLYVSRR